MFSSYIDTGIWPILLPQSIARVIGNAVICMTFLQLFTMRKIVKKYSVISEKLTFSLWYVFLYVAVYSSKRSVFRMSLNHGR